MYTAKIPSAPSGLIAAADKINYHDETFKFIPEKVLTRWDLLITLNALFDDIGYSLELSDSEEIARCGKSKIFPKGISILTTNTKMELRLSTIGT